MPTTGPPVRQHALRLVAFGVLGALVLIELAVRIATGTVFALHGKDSDSYVTIDPLVGRIPKPGIRVRHPNGFNINIGDHGTRSNGDDRPRAERPLTLVVGDSFAFGDGVNDEESWPAVLERLTGRRVINAAVPGFGLDQAVLRAEQLAAVYAPDVIVAGFIPHDILRCELSYWSGHAKPYFDVDAGGLSLHPAAPPSGSVLAPLKRLLSVSITLDRFFPKFLYWEGPEQMAAHQRGREVACRLMQRLVTLGETRHAQIVVVAQPQQPTATAEQRELKDGLLTCAAAAHVLAVDLFPPLDRLSPEQRAQLFERHMTAAGNRFVATELAGFLERHPAPHDDAQ